VRSGTWVLVWIRVRGEVGDGGRGSVGCVGGFGVRIGVGLSVWVKFKVRVTITVRVRVWIWVCILVWGCERDCYTVKVKVWRGTQVWVGGRVGVCLGMQSRCGVRIWIRVWDKVRMKGWKRIGLGCKVRRIGVECWGRLLGRNINSGRVMV